MSSLMIVALTMTLGYLLGRIKVKGLSLGTSGVLLVALVLIFLYPLSKKVVEANSAELASRRAQ